MKKGYRIGIVAIIIFQVFLMETIISERRELFYREIIETKVEDYKSRNNDVYDKESCSNRIRGYVKRVTWIGVGLVSIGYVCLIKEQLKKSEGCKKRIERKVEK